MQLFFSCFRTHSLCHAIDPTRLILIIAFSRYLQSYIEPYVLDYGGVESPSLLQSSRSGGAPAGRTIPSRQRIRVSSLHSPSPMLMYSSRGACPIYDA